ncbi:MAG: helix-turn-helix transcriptional regulator [Desulfobacterales bacterium]
MSVNTIGLYLKRAREKKKLSQKVVAKLLDYKNMNFLSMVENGICKIPANKIMEFVKAYQLPSFFGLVIIREIYGDIWNALIETEKINPQSEGLSFKELDEKIGALYKKELKKYGIKPL